MTDRDARGAWREPYDWRPGWRGWGPLDAPAQRMVALLVVATVLFVTAQVVRWAL